MSGLRAEGVVAEIAADQEDYYRQLRRDYLELARRLSNHESLGQADRARLHEAMERLAAHGLRRGEHESGITSDDLQAHIDAIRKIAPMRQHLETVKRQRDALPPKRETERRIKEENQRLVQQMDELLVTKRELERQLEDRAVADGEVRRAHDQLRSLAVHTRIISDLVE